MDVRIRGWSARNLRGGLRRLEVDLGNPPVRWTLIQMPNGLGKTTTMDLLRKVLTDTPLTPSYVRDLRADDHVSDGSFELQLLIDGRPIRLGFDFDFRDGSATRYTVRAEARGGGKVPGRILPAELGDLITPDLAEMFIFNGELAKAIRDMERQKADDAIRALYRLTQLSPLIGAVERLVKLEQQRAAAMTTAKEDRGLNRLKNARDEAEAAEKRLRAEETLATSRLTQRRREAKELEQAISDRLSEDEGIRKRLEQLTNRQTILTAELGELSSEALSSLRRPQHVHDKLLERLHFLGSRLFELKLPETISSEFFRDLANKDVCVCGRPIGDHEREHILTRSGQYLAQDQISVINQMKLALRESAGDPKRFAELVAAIQSKLAERRKLKAERDRLELERIASGDDTLDRLHKEFQACAEDIERLEQQLDRLTTRDPQTQKALRLSWQNNIPLCTEALRDRRQKYEMATNTRRFALKAEIMTSLIADFAQSALERLRERVRLRTNEKLAQIAPTELLEVRRIAGGLEISSPGVSRKSDVSEGQSLSVAYAFLTSLLSDAPYRLPFVVDSPAVSLDNVSRREVGELIPDFFEQMILFVISSEREDFADTFYTRGDDVRYLTISRLESDVLVETGLEPFRAFQEREAA